MPLTMREVDSFIETALTRLASETGQTRSSFYVDLRSMQTRITQSLVDQCVDICESRNLSVTRVGDGLNVTVDLNTCYFNAFQAQKHELALQYTRSMHGNHI